MLCSEVRVEHTRDADARGQQRLQAAAPAAQPAGAAVAIGGRLGALRCAAEPVLAEEARQRQQRRDEGRDCAVAQHVLWQLPAIDLQVGTCTDLSTSRR